VVTIERTDAPASEISKVEKKVYCARCPLNVLSKEEAQLLMNNVIVTFEGDLVGDLDYKIVAKSWRIVKWNHEHALRGLRRLISGCKSGLISVQDVAKATNCNNEDVETLVELIDTDPTTFRKRGLAALRVLAGLPEIRPSRERKPRNWKSFEPKLEAIEASIGKLWDLEIVDDEWKPVSVEFSGDTRSARVKRYKQGDGYSVGVEKNDKDGLEERENNEYPLHFDPLDGLAEVHSGDASYKHYCTSRKRPQIWWILQRLGGLVDDKSKTYTIVDVGSGKGDLSLNLAHSFPGCKVVGIDTNGDSLQIGAGRAREHNVTNAQFVNADAEDIIKGGKGYDSLQSSFAQNSEVVFVGLHCCGGLSDLVMVMAAKFQASFLCVPCCFHRHVELRTAHCPKTYWGLSEEQGKQLCKLCELNDIRQVQTRAMQLANSARINCWLADHGLNYKFCLSRFSAKFSPKNQVIIGRKCST